MYLSKTAAAIAVAHSSASRKRALRFSGVIGLTWALSALSSSAYAGCEYLVSNQWNSGFTGTIRISNTGTTAINGWNVSWQYANGDRVTSSWNATVSGSNPYAATGLNWNSTIQPGQSAEFGIQGTKGGATAEIPVISGAACAGGVTSSSAPSTSSSSVAISSSSSKVSSSVPSSSSSKSSVVSSSSSVSSVISTGQQCNWYGTLYPLCVTNTSGWGYENNKSCIARSTCAAQPAPYGIVDGGTSSSVATSSSTPSSSSKSSVASSSLVSSSVVSSSSSSIKSSSSSSVASSSSSTPIVGLAFRGVSLAGAEFGTAYPGIYEKDYIYPDQTEVDYFKGKSMNTLRVPFSWERLQPTLGAAFNAIELGRLDAFVTGATAKGVNIVIDPHNYARWNGSLIGSGVSNAQFADLWTRLATRYKSNSKVIFAIMNEPNTMPTEQWLSAANAAIAAIRAVGATNLVLVPGNAWTGASTWNANWYGTPNATVMLNVVDSGNNYAYEVHQYLDSDSSGTSPACVSTSIGVERLTAFTAWLNTNGKRGFLGEFAGADNATCKAAVTNMLQYMQSNNNVWIGWTWWAAGPWWEDYMYTIEPKAGVDRPQMSWLAPFLF